MDSYAEESGTGGSSRRRRWWWVTGGFVAVAALGAVAIGYFGVHTLFFDDVVSEDGPVFASGVAADAPAEPATTSTTSTTAGTAAVDEDESPSPMAEVEPAEPVIVTEATGTFEGVGRYSGAGTTVVLTDGVQRFVRFEDDFSTSNGPDLFVYLGTGSGRYGDPREYIQLGVLRGNIGSQNYEVPAVHPDTGEPIDLSLFDHVAVWCKRFDSTFAIARLM